MSRSGRSEYYDEEYAQVGLPNKPELSRLVKESIGSRTMSAFAELCDTSQSTLSRLINPEYEMKNPVSPALIRKVAENSASNDEEILKKLMEANGMDTRENISNRKFEERDRQEKELYESIKSTIITQLEAKKHSVWELQQSSMRGGGIVPSRFDFDIRSDLLLMVQGKDPRFLNFIIDRTTYYTGRQEDFFSGTNRVSRYTSLFLMDCWESDILRDYWNTIVFTKASIYEQFVKPLSVVEVNGYISVLLIDPDNKKIVKEYNMTRKDGNKVKSFFKG